LEIGLDKHEIQCRSGRKTWERGAIVTLPQMAPPLRIGLFPFLNVQPLIFGLSTEADVLLVIDLPSRIADRFREGELDLAMVPSFEAATLDSPILDSVCVASDGPVETVILHHRKALENVKSLAVDEASRTSAALAKIMIAQASGRIPDTAAFSPLSATTPDTDAIVVIGDPAFVYSRPGFQARDLGLEWQRQHSLPFVFAVMALGPRAVRPGMARRILEATRRGLDAASTIAHSYNSPVAPARAENYMRNVIRYGLGPREKEGLALFYRQAHAKGLLARVKELEFHAI
jgi:chorismate dehydratase